jgi:hypothetical protein
MLSTEVTKPVVVHAQLPKELQNDERIQWIHTKVKTGLMLDFQASLGPVTVISGEVPEGLELPSNPDIFTDCMSRNDGENLQLMADFLEDVPASMSALLFWIETKQCKIAIPKPVEVTPITPSHIEGEPWTVEGEVAQESPVLVDAPVEPEAVAEPPRVPSVVEIAPPSDLAPTEVILTNSGAQHRYKSYGVQDPY